MKSLAEWLELLESRQPSSIQLGTERIIAVRDELGLKLDMPLITVGGTNGKGSTVAYIDSILRAGGFRTGCFFSPHLLDFSERIIIDGRPADESLLCECLEQVEQAAAQRCSAGQLPTYFEFIALAAALAFRQAKCEAVVLEVGLGGRLDAVNAFDADVAVITSIGVDHIEHLGADRTSIAREKAGIMRTGRPVVFGDASMPDSISTHAQQIAAVLLARDRDFSFAIGQESWTYQGKGLRAALPHPAMRGLHQYANASCALCALEQLADQLPIDQAAVRAGLLDAKLPGRFEVLPGPVPIVLDVAHNVAAAEQLCDTLLDMGFFENTLAVFGARANKDSAGIISALNKRIDEWFIAPVAAARAHAASAVPASANQQQNPHRSRDPADQVSLEAAAAAAHGYGASAQIFATVADAAQAAFAKAQPGARIVVFGSFLTVAEFCRFNANTNHNVAASIACNS